MSTVTLDCEFDGCSWQSQNATIDIAIRHLEIHVNAKHATMHASPAPKPEKAKRPELGTDMSEEDWAYFLCRWEEYKNIMSLSKNDLVM